MRPKIIPHPDENNRLKALSAMQILDTPLDERFERITRLACRMFGVPVAAISCVDHRRQWFKSIQGLEVEQTDRCVSFCQHTILEGAALVVEDARFDDRFATNPLVTEDLGIVFYAGVPIRSPDGLPVASMCIIDFEPRAFDNDNILALSEYARTIESLLNTSGPNQVETALIHTVGDSWRRSMIDPLTRLWNHEGLSAIAAESFLRASAKDQQAGIALIDLPSFNQIIRQLGHAQGDQVLRQLGKAMLREIRPTDSLGRINRQQFAIVMNELADRADAQSRLAAITAVCDSFPIKGGDGREFVWSRAAAVHLPRGWAHGVDQVLERLEHELYQMKQTPDAQSRIVGMTPARSAA